MALSQNSAFTQEKKDTVTELNPRIFFLYQCTSNDSIALSASISVKREEGPFALQNAILEFSASAGTETRVLGKGKTDIDGTVILKVPVNAGLPVDKDGMTTYTVSFGGKGKYTKAAESTSAKLAKIDQTTGYNQGASIAWLGTKGWPGRRIADNYRIFKKESQTFRDGLNGLRHLIIQNQPKINYSQTLFDCLKQVFFFVRETIPKKNILQC